MQTHFFVTQSAAMLFLVTVPQPHEISSLNNVEKRHNNDADRR